MTEQKIDVTKEEAGILAGRLKEHQAAVAAVRQSERALADCLYLFRVGKGLPDGAEVLAVDPDAHYVRVAVPSPELVKDAG